MRVRKTWVRIFFIIFYMHCYKRKKADGKKKCQVHGNWRLQLKKLFISALRISLLHATIHKKLITSQCEEIPLPCSCRIISECNQTKALNIHWDFIEQISGEQELQCTKRSLSLGGKIKFLLVYTRERK